MSLELSVFVSTFLHMNYLLKSFELWTTITISTPNVHHFLNFVCLKALKGAYTHYLTIFIF